MKNLVVSTPSRLHFGLFAVGQEVERSFGGVGLMVKAPRTVIKSSASQRFVVRDLSVDKEGSAERVEAVEKVAQKWFEHFGSDASGAWSSYADLPIELEIVTSPLRHTGLGSGTQLAMASGLLLQSSFELPTPKPGELAVGLGRATRSAIGTYGCFEGGLIVDGGKTDTEPVSPIDLRVDFPDDWPIAIVHIVGEENKTASSPAGLHGRDEEAAFEKIPPTTPQQLEGMRALVAEQIVPGVLEKNYQQFAGGVYEFSRRSGEYFSEIQGGPYANQTITEVVNIIHDAGVEATGQSSWGPSVFAIGESWEQLQPAVANLKKRFGSNCHIEIAHADNAGVAVSEDVEATL